MMQPNSKWDFTETVSGAAVYVAHPDAPPVVLVLVDGRIELHRVQFKQAEQVRPDQQEKN